MTTCHWTDAKGNVPHGYMLRASEARSVSPHLEQVTCIRCQEIAADFAARKAVQLKVESRR